MSRSWPAVVLAGIAAALAGCRTTSAPDAGQAARPVTVTAAGPPPASPSPAAAPTEAASPGDPDVLATIEPCATRLHDVAGVMLLYYALHKRLPAELDELHAIADLDQALDFTCPASGRPYVYTPAGLRFPGKDERLVLYDVEAAHDGARWGVLAAPPKGERPAAMWAVRLPDEVFNVYAAPTP